MPVNGAAAAGLRRRRAGPYVAHGHGEASAGTATGVVGLAMIAGNLAYAPLDRPVGSRERMVLAGNPGAGLVCAGLQAAPMPGAWAAVAARAAIGVLGSSSAVIMAHGRAFVPAHPVGRGVTLLNLLSRAGVATMRFATGSSSRRRADARRATRRSSAPSRWRSPRESRSTWRRPTAPTEPIRRHPRSGREGDRR